MTKAEKAIKGLECCTTSLGCKVCPYSENGVGTDVCQLESSRDALETLKDQRAKRAEYMRRWRKAHPERECAAQIRKAANLLKRNGYSVDPVADRCNSTNGGEAE